MFKHFYDDKTKIITIVRDTLNAQSKIPYTIACGIFDDLFNVKDSGFVMCMFSVSYFKQRSRFSRWSRSVYLSTYDVRLAGNEKEYFIIIILFFIVFLISSGDAMQRSAVSL